MTENELPENIWNKMDKFDREWFKQSDEGTLPESKRSDILNAASDHEFCGNWEVGSVLRNLKYKK